MSFLSVYVANVLVAYLLVHSQGSAVFQTVPARHHRDENRAYPAAKWESCLLPTAGYFASVS